MDIRNKYKIPFTGLKEGRHEILFTTDKEFFDYFTYDYVENIELTAKVELEKMSTMMILGFYISGNYTTQCDRCGEDLIQDFETNHKMFVKFGEGESIDEDILFLDQSEYEIYVSDLIFELFVTSVSARHVHHEDDCNSEVLKKIEELRVKDKEQQHNPIWDKLNDLKK